MLLTVSVIGEPYEIGVQHGQQARDRVHGSIAFYEALFMSTTKMTWPEVRTKAMQFDLALQSGELLRLREEMQGVAAGAGVEYADVLALNVRTEINFGMFSDGCTALSWKTKESSFLAQNWDWKSDQKNNLIALVIRRKPQDHRPAIKMITEAGIIGKIGFNSAGVGVCLNAIRAKGVRYEDAIPCHLALRLILESQSVADAVKRVPHIASSCHTLIADANGSLGVEWSSKDEPALKPNAQGQIFHTNHYVLEHEDVIENAWLSDSPVRLKRIEELCAEVEAGGGPSLSNLAKIFTDESSSPGAICRTETAETGSATLFTIVIDVQQQKYAIRLGNGAVPGEEFEDYVFPGEDEYE